MNGENKSKSNWMRFVNCSLSEQQQNVRAVQFRGEVYYETCVEIAEDVELLVWYGNEYADELGLLSDNPVDVLTEAPALDSTNTGFTFNYKSYNLFLICFVIYMVVKRGRDTDA